MGRGAGSLKDAARLTYTLAPMSEDDADLLGLDAHERAALARLDLGKVNLVRRNPHPRWFKLISIRLGNKSEIYPNGDEIQTVERWSPPDVFKGLSTLTLNAVLDEIDNGLAGGKLYSDHNRAGARSVLALVVCNG